MNKHAKGAFMVIVSAVCFGLMPLMTKIIYASGSNPITVVLLRFSIALPFIMLYLIRCKIPLKLTRTEVRHVVIISVFGYGGTALIYFAAFSRIPSGLTVTLHFIYPVLVIAAGVLLFKQRVTLLRVASVLLCVCGIALLSGSAKLADPLGMVFAFLSGATYAFYIIYLDRSGLGSMNTMKLIFYMNAIAAALMLLLGAATGQLDLPDTGKGWIVTVALSIFISLGAVQLFQAGLRRIGSQRAAILSTFEPLTGVIVGITVYSEPFSVITALGSLLVLAAVSLTAFEKQPSAGIEKAPAEEGEAHSDAAE